MKILNDEYNEWFMKL